jgi:hypothetical protein
VVYAQNLSSKGVPKMVQQDVETIETLDEDVQQLDVEVTQQADGEVAETLEEEAQQIAIEQGYFEGSIPSDIPPPPGLLPKRAELARFIQWRRRAAAELEQLKEVTGHRSVGR